MRTEWTLITVTHNSAVHLAARWAGATRENVRWLVVDNASTDDSVSLATELGADVIQLERNVGFSRANNVGLRAATSEWVAFVNPDVEVAVSTLDALADLSSHHGALVAPQLLSADGRPQANGRGLPFLVDKLANRGLRLPGARHSLYVPDTSTCPTYVAWVIGAVVAGPRSTFEELGGWAERFFLYYEDHDLGLRSWQAGHPVIVDPSIRWLHDWQRATTRFELAPWKREIASAWRFFRRYPEFALPTRRLAAARHSAAAARSGSGAERA